MEFQRISICLDMAGCPNRCRHCWIGHSPNGNLSMEALQEAAEQFHPYAKELTVYDWYREPDFRDNYKELWTITNALSDVHEEHFELASIWRLARDPDYAAWLSELGVKKCQLTIFGREEITDRYTGRKGAYRDILKSIDILLSHGIVPRIQFFLNKETAGELPFMEELIRELCLEERCRELGADFSFFLHSGSCDGENAKHYPIWVTPEDLLKIPDSLKKYTLKHFGVDSLNQIFGQTEADLVRQLLEEDPRESLVEDSPVFYIDKDLNVYPNITGPSLAWCLGNLREDGAAVILHNYAENRSIAQNAWQKVPMEQLLELADKESQRLFQPGDYLIYLLNRYCSKHIQKGAVS